MELKADVSYLNESLMTKSTKSEVAACIAIQLDKHLEDIRYQMTMNSENISTIKTCMQVKVRGTVWQTDENACS